MKKLLITTLMGLFLTGCASEDNVVLDEAYWQKSPHHVAVTAVKAPEPGITFVGSRGLLDVAISNAVTRQLSTHIANTTDVSWYYSLPDEFTEKLKQRHIIAKSVDQSNNEKINIPNIVTQHHVDEVLVLRLQAVGVVRPYNGFIPTGAPEAYCKVTGELVNTTSKAVLWRHKAVTKLPIQGEWDQPPTYPNVTAAIKKAIATSRQAIINSLFLGSESKSNGK